MCAKPDKAELRDQAFARLVADALKPGGSSAAGIDGACPDPEVVAAYADQGLTDSQRAQLENHIAACDRCQKILVALGAGLEAATGESVAVLPSSAPAPRPATRPSAPSERWVWWLSAAFGSAAAVFMWMALRPAPPDGTAALQTAANYSQPTAAVGGAAGAPTAAPSQGRTRSAPPTRDAKTLDDLSKARSAAKQTAPGLPVQSYDSGGNSSAMRSEIAATTASPQAPIARTTDELAAELRQSVPPAPQASPADSRATNQTFATLSATLGGTLSQQPVTNLPLNGRSFAQLNLSTPSPSQQSAQRSGGAPVRVNLYTFSPPDGSATWRLGMGGSIEHSTDHGKTWEPQSSGVTVDLIAGSSSSKDAAWVVGRGHVILRTSDGGEHWMQVLAPTGLTADWAAVAAHDANNVTVVLNDLRRFSTRDGGATWVLQP